VDKLPTQLKWAQFVRVLEKLGYKKSKNVAGVGRTFTSTIRTPNVVSFHEPHGSNPLPNGTLSEYLRKLQIGRNEFFSLLEDLRPETSAIEEDRFKRYTDGKGLITSVCSKCFGTVIQSVHDHEVDAAEASHPCFNPAPAD
jgi:hypothetical protein